MATNIVNIGFKGTYPSSTADRTGYVSDGDNNDIFYFMGTNYGTQAWANPEGTARLTTTHTGLASSYDDLSRPTDNQSPANASGGGGQPGISPNASSQATLTFNFLTCKVRPTRVDVSTYSLGNGAPAYAHNNRQVQVSNNGSTWITLNNAGNASLSNAVEWWNVFDDNSVEEYYQYVRYVWTVGTQGFSWQSLGEVKIYGDLFRTDGGTGSFVTPVNTIEQLPKYVDNNLQHGDLLYYAGGTVTSRRRLLYNTSRLTMTGTLAISAEYFPNFYILNPDGSPRNVDLPASPLDETFLRFKTLDGTNAITIRESGPTTIATLNTTTPVIDLYYSNSTWTVVNYG